MNRPSSAPDPSPASLASSASLASPASPVQASTGASKAMSRFDGVLLLSFGGPEAPEDVVPFLRSVTGGKDIPEDRLRVVGQHYFDLGGRSPLGDNNRALLAALRREFAVRDLDLPLLWSNRHAAPYTADVLREAGKQGIRRLLVLLTSAYSSYASCRSYREHLAAVAAELADDGEVTFSFAKLAPYATRPAYARQMARLAGTSIRALDGMPDADVALLFVTHSIPETMDELSGPGDGEGHAYVAEHRDVMAAVTSALNVAVGRSLRPELVFCSQSGRPGQAWLQPDVSARIRELSGQVAAA